jgi:23S rRNA pseudouridine955/2504/2580 synthase/23S rRNA pseudouridine1911/1915/1917 synthase
MKWKVESKESGLNLIAFLKSKLPDGHSLRQLKRALEAGCCELNGRIERFGSKRLGLGDAIAFDPSLLSIDKQQFTVDPQSILYEDEYLFAYDKPAHVVSDSKETLQIFHKYNPKLILLHRLDKETTGVLLFAKDADTEKKMLDLFRERKIKKNYLAIVDGVLEESEGLIENHLGKIGHYQGQTLWGEVGKKSGSLAVTRWVCEKQYKDYALVRCLPETGRTHQIRVHMSGLGHPILGDFQYCKKFQCRHKPERYLLHSYTTTFIHPKTKQKLTITAPIPNDFSPFLI